MWVLGVTLGGLLVSAMLVVVCGAWLVWRRRRRQSTDTETSGENTRVQPETADSEVASSRNNMSPYYSRYTRSVRVRHSEKPSQHVLDDVTLL